MLHTLFAAALLVAGTGQAAGEQLRIAAAADLKYAFAEIVETFRSRSPQDRVDVIFGSSGKFHTQIRNGAPFDLYFSADIAYPNELRQHGLTATEPKLYAIGRIVLWSLKPALGQLPLRDLAARSEIRKFAIANPDHAPYGRRSREALEHAGVWQALKARLVLGENIAHAAQFVDSGAAEAGIIALSLAKSPALENKGAWTLIPAQWHKPLEQAYVITRRAKDNALAAAFAGYMETSPARAVMRRYGFVLPGE
ncbi:MAG: molybdate ABC transporter substrate-binding protein [Gammaproteobacteria bacterium]